MRIVTILTRFLIFISLASIVSGEPNKFKEYKENEPAENQIMQQLAKISRDGLINKKRTMDALRNLNDLRAFLRKRMDRKAYCQVDYNKNVSSMDGKLPIHCKTGEQMNDEMPPNPPYKIQYLDAEPYSGNETRKILENIIHDCCKNRAKIITSNESADFIYPVLGDDNEEMAFGYYFIPLLSPSGGFYITVKKIFSLSDLVGKCLELWPILVVCIFLSAIAGFVAWLLETWRNKEEFPRPFLRGWSEGIWWSFVSMTTVGYGDIAPKSLAARLFSIIWILAGIITFSILSGEVTSVILDANTPQVDDMAGKMVGVLSQRIYDISLVVRNGGTPKPGNGTEMGQIYSLIEQLQQEKVEGVLLDKNTFWKISADIQHKRLRGKVFKFFLENTATTDIPHSGHSVSYGVLVKDIMKYWYFGSTMKSRRMRLQNTLTSGLSTSDVSSEPHMFNTMFNENYLFLCIVLLLVFCMGIVLEAYRKRRKIAKARSSMFGKTRRDKPGNIHVDDLMSCSDKGFAKDI